MRHRTASVRAAATPTVRPATRAFRRLALGLSTAMAIGVGAAATPAGAATDREITDALIWTGVSSRVARNRLDRRDRVPIRLAEDRIGGRPDGYLDGGELRAVLAAARHARGREGYRLLTDPATGARIGLPTAWLAGREATDGGSRWRSPDGAIAVETFRRPGPLESVEHAERRNGTKVTYSAGGTSWRVVSGFTPDGRTVYARAARRGGEVTGFRAVYETGLGPRLDRVAVAMSSDFRGFAAPLDVNALAYAPDGEGAPADDRFGAIERSPRFGALPASGPAPRARPEQEVASLGPVAPPVELDLPEPSPPLPPEEAEAPAAPGTPEREAPATERAAPAPAGPVDLLDEGDNALAPPRPLDRPTPDMGKDEPAVPNAITGLITDEGQSCPTLRGPDGTLYALVGEVPSLAPGTLVRVETVGVDTEACTAGRTVSVGGLRVLQSP